MTKEKILAALDKPRKVYALTIVVNPSGSVEEVQTLLMQMREEGLVKFDINKGMWSRGLKRTGGPPAAWAYVFKKFNGRPPRGQSIATNSPLPASVM